MKEKLYLCIFAVKFSSMKEYFDALRKYNFWNGNIPESGFIRENYTDKRQQMSCGEYSRFFSVATDYIPVCYVQ
jgi:hypothetical protein